MSKVVLVTFLWLDKMDYIWETGSFMTHNVTQNPLTHLYCFDSYCSEIPPWQCSLCVVFTLFHNFPFITREYSITYYKRQM